MEDAFGRSLTTMRVSITNRCNLRCSYCMPPEGVKLGARSDLLTFEELSRVVEVAAGLGLQKVRLTGGEPLLRTGVADFVERLTAIPRLKEVALTTNGQRLATMAEPLAEAGLAKVNVSLDTLDKAGYHKLTRGGELERVLAGLEAVKAVELPLKLNCVVMRGVNDDQLAPLVELGGELGAQVRFIEYMPMDGGNGWAPEQVVRAPEILANLQGAGFSFKALPANGGVAKVVQVNDNGATLGLITPMSKPFCGGCNRLRLSAEGTLFPCLYSTEGLSLRSALREGYGDIALAGLLAEAVAAKPAGSPMATHSQWNAVRSMSGIGG